VVEQLAVTPIGALTVVIATVVMYLIFLVLVRVMGQRSLAAMSPYDVAAVIALGAVVGRTALLAVPTLGSGVIALVTLFVIQRVFGWAHRRGLWFGRLFERKPVLLMVGDQVCHDALRRVRISPDELRERLRLAGVARLEQVGCVVLEVNGQISVVRSDSAPDPLLFDDVPGASAALHAVRCREGE
jgi:uncharacterized membrane protein YcaP (DUF421 family)